MLTSEERSAVAELLNCHVEHPDSFASSSLAERAKKRLKTENSDRWYYIDTRFLLRTSNTCERIFQLQVMP